jgi:L-ascorbate metabolism protein UlaG (beta-lactamase superfamily)
MKVTYFGHACFLIELSGFKLLFDPFIRGNDSAKLIDIDSIEADYILVSHGHDDHTADLVYLSKKTGALVIASWEITQWLIEQGVDNVHPMNTGGKRVFEFGELTMTFASHSNSLPNGRYGGLAAGFIIKNDAATAYYSGDTGLFGDMRMLGEQYQIDLALLPIGGNFTMDVTDAVTASKWIHCNKIIGLHYDTFGYIVINQNDAIKKFADQGLQLNLLKSGEGFTV